MTISTDVDAREVLAERLVDGLTGAMETLGVYLGAELGLYRALADLGEATEAEVAGYLACDDATLPAAERRYRLPVDTMGVGPTPGDPGTRLGQSAGISRLE